MQDTELKRVKFAKTEDGRLWLCELINGQWVASRPIKYIIDAETKDIIEQEIVS